MIKINRKINLKLAENFPQDPYADITIITKSYRLQLVLAYLSMDSTYFQSIPQSTKQIDLSNLQQEPLIRVLKSLYGAILETSSVDDLTNVYTIIEYLQIDEYRQNIMDEIIKNQHLLDSLQMLQFSFKFDILVQNFKSHHFENKLKSLGQNKNYLQLNKVTQKTINSLLLDYEYLVGEEGHQTINNVLENYMYRNGFSSYQYFTPDLEILKEIWEKFHHSIQYAQMIKAEKNKSSITFNNAKDSTNSNMSQKNQKIKQLQKQISVKNQIIQKLQQENNQLRKQLEKYIHNTNQQLQKIKINKDPNELNLK